MKNCTKCKEIRPLKDFRKAPHHKDGLTSHCSFCISEYHRRHNKTNVRERMARCKEWSKNNPQKEKEYQRRYRNKYKEKIADKLLRKTYGVTLDQKRAMFEAQEGLCSACKDPLYDLTNSQLDHNHSTGKIRDLLCNCCNLSLGLAKESSSRLSGLIRYLERHEQ